jgi:hypothetical protein
MDNPQADGGDIFGYPGTVDEVLDLGEVRLTVQKAKAEKKAEEKSFFYEHHHFGLGNT